MSFNCFCKSPNAVWNAAWFVPKCNVLAICDSVLPRAPA